MSTEDLGKIGLILTKYFRRLLLRQPAFFY